MLDCVVLSTGVGAWGGGGALLLTGAVLLEASEPGGVLAGRPTVKGPGTVILDEPIKGLAALRRFISANTCDSSGQQFHWEYTTYIVKLVLKLSRVGRLWGCCHVAVYKAVQRSLA